ncbi:hypothetical protein [Bosea sp. (in: a-proteobacteria)]|uniref:hypothetical protein n=1 Tax=Bosea sp. (in: a-proteobacteria) TaxID=1871050 RepID=UPI0027333C63|nr:hypothetical protein [Bosea sp. (in: a-proteobacteria)]MDP3409658.1 hypothetical protein [Bosea sp. (in: a-proteobacteria)]
MAITIKIRIALKAPSLVSSIAGRMGRRSSRAWDYALGQVIHALANLAWSGV